jgi:hypothetical protein
MIIKVTQDDINIGARFNRCLCPVALAIKRAINDKQIKVKVGSFVVILNSNKNKIACSIPDYVSKFISDFDFVHEEDKPFEFELPIEDFY